MSFKKNLLSVSLIIINCLLLSLPSAFSQQWKIKAAIPVKTAYAGAAVVNGIIYVAGGYNDSATKILSALQAYDPSANKWSTLASMQYKREEPGVAAVNGKIYAIGGFDGANAVNYVEEYDPSTNKWVSKATMPTSRSQIGVAVINNKIYVVGGWPVNISKLEVYDPATDKWATKTSIPTGRAMDNASVSLKGLLYCIGGMNAYNTVYYSNMSVYDPSTDRWTLGDSLPKQRWAGSVSVVNGQIQYFGGATGIIKPNYFNHYILDSNTMTWYTGLPMPYKRSHHVSATVNNKLYIIGGEDSVNKQLNTVLEYSEGCMGATVTVYDTIHIYDTIKARDTLVILYGSGINNTNPQASIKIFPNPTRDFLNISIDNYSAMGAYSIRIINPFGQQVFQTKINQALYTIDFKTLHPPTHGFDIVEIIDPSGKVIQVGKIEFIAKL